MRFLFLGAGAIGTYIGGSLAASGQEVAFIEQPQPAASIRRTGLTLHIGKRTRVVHDVALFTEPREALDAGPWDVGVFALKSFDTESALDGLIATGRPVPTPSATAASLRCCIWTDRGPGIWVARTRCWVITSRW